MPYVRKTAYKKKTYSKSKRVTDGAKALKMVKNLTKAVEVKHTDLTVLDATVASGVILPICYIGPGATDSTKIGDKAQLKSIHLRLLLQIATGVSCNMRLIIFKTPCVMSTLPVSTDIVISNGIATHFVLDGDVRFQVVYDRIHYIVSGDTSKAYPSYLNTYVKCKNVIYDNDGANIKNNYHMLVLHDTTNEYPAITGVSRIKFIDP